MWKGDAPMGLMSRMTTVFKSKVSKVLDQVEDPRETLEYSYKRQLEMLQQVKRGLADVVTSKKRLELQAAQLKDQVGKLEDQARRSLQANREDLATLALQRKQAAEEQLAGLDQQVAELEKEQEKLSLAESRLSAKVESFRTQKEVIKAQYSAAEASVKIGEAATGLGEEMADVGMAIERAKDKTEGMKARAAAIDELVSQGALEDPLGGPGGGDEIERQLGQISSSQKVKADLERLKKEVAGK